MSRFICHHGTDTDETTCVQCDIEHMKRKPSGNANSPASSMTLRERFAMAAMEGILASNRGGSSIVLDVATLAREQADALINELAQEPRR